MSKLYQNWQCDLCWDRKMNNLNSAPLCMTQFFLTFFDPQFIDIFKNDAYLYFILIISSKTIKPCPPKDPLPRFCFCFCFCFFVLFCVCFCSCLFVNYTANFFSTTWLYCRVAVNVTLTSRCWKPFWTYQYGHRNNVTTPAPYYTGLTLQRHFMGNAVAV